MPDPGAPRPAGSRSGRSGSSADRRDGARSRRGRRPCLPRGARTGGRHADPRPRRLRPRRGGRPGRLRHGARALAVPRRAGQPGRVDHDDRPQPGDRPAPPEARCRREGRELARDEAFDASARRARCSQRWRTRCTRSPDDRLRLIFTCCHPALAPESAGRPDAAHARRPDDPGDRPRLPRPGADARPAAGPGQAEDPRRGHPVPGAAGPTRLPERLDSVLRGPLPRLQRGLRRVARATRSSGASCARRRSGWPGSSRRSCRTSRRRSGCWR